MSSTAYSFDASTVAPSTGTSSNLPVSPPEGWPVQIIAAEMKQTASKDGHFVEFTLQITEGDNLGAVGAYRLNLGNENEQTVFIAASQLSSLCHVTGVMQFTDFMALANIPFRVIVVMQTGADAVEKGYTEVKQVLDVNGNKPSAGGAVANPAASPASAPQFHVEAGSPEVATTPPATVPATGPPSNQPQAWPSTETAQAAPTVAAQPAQPPAVVAAAASVPPTDAPAPAPAPAAAPAAAPAPAAVPPAAGGKPPWMQ